MNTSTGIPRQLRGMVAVASVLALLLIPACEAGTPPNPGGSPVDHQVSTPAAPDVATKDGTVVDAGTIPKLQAITGLGVNANVHNWHGGELKPAIDMIAQMGHLTWRVIIDRADWEPTRYGSADTFDWGYYEKIYSTGKMADLFDTIEYINSIDGQQVSVNVMGGVPDWMGSTHIDVDQEDYWVRMIASMVQYGRVERKLDFSLLSPMNEIDVNGIEGPLVDPAQYVRLMEKLSVQLDKLGLNNMKFVGPDTGSPEKAVHDYWPAIAASPTLMEHFAHFGIHTYDGTTAGIAEVLGADAAVKFDVWVTEFSGPCPGCDDGAPNPASWDGAQDTAGLAIWLLRHGMSGLQFYDAWDGYYEHHKSIGYWGLLAYDAASKRYTPRKNYYVLRQLFEFVAPGSARIECTSSVEAVQVACFLDPGTAQLVVYGSNDGDQETTVKVTMPQMVASADMLAYRTDTTANMAPAPNAHLDAGSVSFTAGAHSVFTLASQPRS